MISSAVTTRKSLKKSVCFRKNKKKKTVTLTDAVRRVFAYQQKVQGQFGVFFISQDISICKVGSVRFKGFLKCYPNALVGLYDGKLMIGDLIDDLSEYFTDEVAN